MNRDEKSSVLADMRMGSGFDEMLFPERAGPGSVTIVQNWQASLGKAR